MYFYYIMAAFICGGIAAMHADIMRVTRAIEDRSQDLRDEFLGDIDAMRQSAPDRKQLSCGNLAHGMAACSSDDKTVIR